MKEVATARRTQVQSNLAISGAFLVIAFAVALMNSLRYLAQRHSLWQDEISAATHGLQPWATFWVEIIRNDIHPWVYFGFLKIWEECLSGSDRGLLLSSLILQFLALLCIAAIAYREYGPQTAAFSSLIYASLPVFAAQAGNLRMYALISVLAPVYWWSGRQLLCHGRVRDGLQCVLLGTLLSYTQAIAFLFAGLIAIAALLSIRGERRPLHIRAWVLAQLATLLLILPLPILALFRSGPNLESATHLAMLLQPSSTLLPWGGSSGGAIAYEGAFCALLVAACLRRNGRIMMLMLPGAAWALSLASGLTGHSIFRDYVFAAFLLPFVALYAGAGVAFSRKGTLAALTLSACLASSVFTWISIPGHTPAENYAPAAAFLKTHLDRGDVVVIPHYDVFWGMLRYGVGPDWGEPLAIMPLRSDEKWRRIAYYLGPRLAAALHLVPHTDRVLYDGVAFITAQSADVCANTEGRTWLVLWNGDRRIFRVSPGQSIQGVRRFGKELTISLLTAPRGSRCYRPGAGR